MANLWKAGIGHVLLSRQLGSGEVAFAVFLVDMYCFGVKDVMINVLPARPTTRTSTRK